MATILRITRYVALALLSLLCLAFLADTCFAFTDWSACGQTYYNLKERQPAFRSAAAGYGRYWYVDAFNGAWPAGRFGAREPAWFHDSIDESYDQKVKPAFDAFCLADPMLTGGHLGFAFWLGNLSTGTMGSPHWYGVVWSIPRWFAVLVTGLWPFFLVLQVVIRRINDRRRTAAGCCPKCGYDLRASPDYCPECGTVVKAN